MILTVTKNNRGITLFEIIVVTLIMAGLAATVIPRFLGSRGNPLRNKALEIGNLTRKLHYSAKLQNKSYRLAIDLTPDNQSYWVEVGPAKVLIDGPDVKKDKKSKDDKKESASVAEGFQKDGTILRKPGTLPRGAAFDGVEVTSQKGVVRSGIAYIHFFASGLGDMAAIHFNDGKDAKFTVAVNPLTGKVRVETKDMTLKEFEDQF